MVDWRITRGRIQKAILRHYGTPYFSKLIAVQISRLFRKLKIQIILLLVYSFNFHSTFPSSPANSSVFQTKLAGQNYSLSSTVRNSLVTPSISTAYPPWRLNSKREFVASVFWSCFSILNSSISIHFSELVCFYFFGISLDLVSGCLF